MVKCAESGEVTPRRSCANCGFVAKYTRPAQQRWWQHFLELDEWERAEGQGFKATPEPFVGEVDTEPVCFRNQIDIPFLLKKAIELGTAKTEAFKQILQEDRANCAGWYSHTQGFGPQAHLEQLKAQQLEAGRRQWEADMEKEHRAFQERLDNSNKGFLAGLEAQRRKWEQDANKWPNRLIWGAIILALAEVVGTVLTLPAITRWLGLD